MIWYDDLYFGGRHIKRRYKKIKRKIIRGVPHEPVYVIALPSAGSGLLEIIPSTQLLQEAYPRDDMRIVGMASDRVSASHLVCRMIDEIYQNRGDFDFEKYLGLEPEG